MLKANLQLKIGQNLALTPQLQQTIRLLQYSTLELQQQIQEMMEQNPLLDTDEAPTAQAEAPAEYDNPYEKADVELPGPDTSQVIPSDLPVDTSWDSIYDNPSPQSTAADSNTDYLENQPGAGNGLSEHLLEQLELMPLTEMDMAIGRYLIHNLNDDGYLQDPLEDLLSDLHEMLDEELTLEEVQVMQHTILQLDPIGCGASNLQQSLLCQLRANESNAPAVEHARALVENSFAELEKQNIKQLAQASGLDQQAIEEAMLVIRRLNPRPGSIISGKAADYVTPDVYVSQLDGVWQVSLNPEISPRLRVHPFYSSLVKRGDKSTDNQYIRDQLQEARWFIKSIQSRNETILKVAEAIVRKQQDFFEYGEEAMHPMVLRDIAEELEMHESTISRVTTQKYMLTPKGMFEFKYFFSSQLSTSDGGNASATAIRAMIRSLVQEENPQKPLSDSKIASILLQKKGVKVARRTIAKYREAMQIPPSNERKRIT